MDLTTVNAKLGLLSASGFIERAASGWRLTKSGKTTKGPSPRPHPTPPNNPK